VISGERAGDGRLLAEYFEREKVECVKITPSQLKALLSGGGRKVLPCRRLVLGGEAWSWEWLEELGAGCEVMNHYGPTECTVGAVAGQVERNGNGKEAAAGEMRSGRSGNVPLGRPLKNVQVYVLDARMKPVGVGMKGELYIGGAGVGRGYLQRAGMTADRFIPDGFSGVEGARLYRTGDVVRWLEEGKLEYVGRSDEQVKIRGYRIEPGEVAAVLEQQSGVGEAVVVAREESSGEKRLVGYVVEREGERIDKAELRQSLQRVLPEYMVPSAIVVLEAMPLTANGKLDRRALPAPEISGSAEMAEPRDTTEIQLRYLWEEILGVKNLGIHDNFFSLGGHSLLAVSLSARLSDLYGSRFAVRTIFEKPTIAELANFLRENVAYAPPTSLVPIQPYGSQTPFFAVHPVGGMAQCYMELSRLLGADQPFYGLQSRGMEEEQAALASVEEMAAGYIKDMRAVQPSGPYQLGGWSMGGVIAYEMAQQLMRDGEEVKVLALFDSRPNFHPDDSAATEEEVAQGEQKYIVSILSEAGISPEEISRLSFQQQLEICLEKAAVPFHITPSQYRRFIRIRTINEMAAARYRIKPYAGSLSLFKSILTEKVDETYGWANLAEVAELFLLPEKHSAFMDQPNVQQVAENLAPLLAKNRMVATAGADLLRDFPLPA
jgi:thioesterase domain-containing protein